MQIIIDGKPAVLKKDSSFEYVSENRLFTDSDGYSLKIEFPLEGCKENFDIFGWLTRLEFVPEKTFFSAIIVDGDMVLKGALAIINMDNKCVQGQFLEGRSADNFYSTLENIYIDQLDLGKWPEISPSECLPGDTAMGQMRRKYGAVTLAWVNDNADGFLNNSTKYPSYTGTPGELYTWQWSADTKDIGLSWQTWLIDITKKICEAIGYEYDFTVWEASFWNDLLLCNTLPASWDMTSWSLALPHWNVKEYFENLETFMFCEFDIDNNSKKIKMDLPKNILEQKGYHEITEILDEFSSEIDIDEDPTSKYSGCKSYRFPDRGDEEWKWLSCPYVLEKVKNNGEISIEEYETVNDFSKNFFGLMHQWTETPENRHSKGFIYLKKLFYVKETNTFYALRVLDKECVISRSSLQSLVAGIKRNYFTYTTWPMPINIFGANSTDEDAEDLNVVPVRIDNADDYETVYEQKVMFLDPGSYSDDSYNEALDEDDEEDDRTDKSIKVGEHIVPSQGYVGKIIESGSADSQGAFYDKLYVGFLKGDGDLKWRNQYVYPLRDYAELHMSAGGESFETAEEKYSMRVNGGEVKEAYPEINERIKTTIKFLSDTLPNVRSVFIIRGQRYLCEKITMTMSEKGRSKEMKGVFYRLR